MTASDPVFREGDRLLLPVTNPQAWGTGEHNTLVRVHLEGGGFLVVPASLLVRESEVRARALEDMAKIAEVHAKRLNEIAQFYRPPRLKADERLADIHEQAGLAVLMLVDQIRALIEKPEGERS